MDIRFRIRLGLIEFGCLKKYYPNLNEFQVGNKSFCNYPKLPFGWSPSVTTKLSLVWKGSFFFVCLADLDLSPNHGT